MNLLQKYKHYINDNPKDYWFKRKAFGWGWTPVTWQGWMITGLYLAIILFLALSLDESSSRREVVLIFMLPLVILTTTFIRIVYLKGESPRWSWGFPKKNNSKKNKNLSH